VSVPALIKAGRTGARKIIADKARLEVGPKLYQKFRDKKDGCTNVVMKP
jgi:hypothetical protein